MKKLIIILLGYLLLTSCKEKKTELIQSKVKSNLFLLKNPPKDDSLTKRIIKDFLLKNPKIPRYSAFLFYKYTYNTKYFINNLPDPGGFSSEELSNYPEDEIATFLISKCKNDSTKLVGRLHFYGLKGLGSGIKKIDTLIYECK